MDTLVHVGRGLLGILAFIGIAFCFSSNRRAVPWRLVGVGVMLQIAFGVLVLKVDLVRVVIEKVGQFFVKILDFNTAGAEFLFGSLITNKQSFGFLFAFHVLPTIVFFSALTSLFAATSAGDAPAVAPAATSSSMPGWERFQTVRVCPASMRCFAIGRPMMPSPMKPIRMVGSS